MTTSDDVDDRAEASAEETPPKFVLPDLPEPAVWVASGVLLLALLVTSPGLSSWAALDVVEYLVAAVLLPQLFARASWSMLAVGALALVATRSGAPLLVGVVLLGVVVVAVVGRAQRFLAVAGTAVLVLVAFDPFDRGTWATGWWVAALLVPVVADVAFGPRSRSSWQRRLARWLGLGAVVLLALVAVTSLSTVRAANSVRTTLGGAIDAARAGDIDVAAAALTASADRCATVHDGLSGLRGLALRILPGIGTHAGPAARFGGVCETELDALSGSVSRVRAALKSTDKQYDLTAVAALEQEISLVRSSLWTLAGGTRDLLADLPIPHPPASIERRLADIDRARDRLQTLKPLASKLSDMLGGRGVRRYFLMFVTPAEARPLGGFMGNWAILKADHGKVEVERSGRSADLSNFNYGKLRLTDLKDYRVRYQSWLRGGLTTPFDPDIWLLYTITPDLPTAGEVARQLAPQSGIGDIDGVVMVDIASMAHLLTLTGPLALPEFNITLDATNAEKVLLDDQYRLFTIREVRVPFLQRIGDELTSRLLGDDIGFTKLISAMRPDIERGGIGAWLVNDEEQAAAVTAEIAPSFPVREGRDGFIVDTANRSPNKLDTFVKRTIRYEAVYDPATGMVTAQGHIELTNTFDPTVGSFHYESGNLLGDPEGSVRNIVCVHTGLAVRGGSVTWFETKALGWLEDCTEVLMLPGETKTLDIELAGTVDAGGYCFIGRGQPTVVPDSFHLVVRHPDGSVVVDTHLDGAKPQWLVGPACADGP